MLRRRSDRRGLAEIVGTLMLVVIVVAAAVAFSIFVASYQGQLQREETAAHDKSLEKLHTVDVSPYLPGVNGSFRWINLSIVSGDVDYMNLTSYSLDGNLVTEYDITAQGGTPTSCTWPDPGSACTVLSPYGAVTVLLLDPVAAWLSPASDLVINVFTQLSNDFTFTFVPPSAVASVTFVQDGGTSVPLFSGVNSLQAPEADNATIVSYAWSIVAVPGNGTPTMGDGEVFEVVLEPGPYKVYLNVTNSDGLTGLTSIPYSQPP